MSFEFILPCFYGVFFYFTGIFNIEECHASDAICAHRLLENVSVFLYIFVNRMKYRQKKNIELNCESFIFRWRRGEVKRPVPSQLACHKSASVTVDRGINTKNSSNFPFNDSMQFLFPYLVS